MSQSITSRPVMRTVHPGGPQGSSPGGGDRQVPQDVRGHELGRSSAAMSQGESVRSAAPTIIETDSTGPPYQPPPGHVTGAASGLNPHIAPAGAVGGAPVSLTPPVRGAGQTGNLTGAASVLNQQVTPAVRAAGTSVPAAQQGGSFHSGASVTGAGVGLDEDQLGQAPAVGPTPPRVDVRVPSPGHWFPTGLRARGEDGPIAGEARPYAPNRDDAIRAATVPDSTGSFMVLSSNTLGAQSVVSVNPAESLVASVASSDGVLVGQSTSSSSQGAHTQDMSTLAASTTVGHTSTPETQATTQPDPHEQWRGTPLPRDREAERARDRGSRRQRSPSSEWLESARTRTLDQRREERRSGTPQKGRAKGSTGYSHQRRVASVSHSDMGRTGSRQRGRPPAPLPLSRETASRARREPEQFVIATDASLTEQPSPAATDYYAGLEEQTTPAYDQGTLDGSGHRAQPASGSPDSSGIDWEMARQIGVNAAQAVLHAQDASSAMEDVVVSTPHPNDLQNSAHAGSDPLLPLQDGSSAAHALRLERESRAREDQWKQAAAEASVQAKVAQVQAQAQEQIHAHASQASAAVHQAQQAASTAVHTANQQATIQHAHTSHQLAEVESLLRAERDRVARLESEMSKVRHDESMRLAEAESRAEAEHSEAQTYIQAHAQATQFARAHAESKTTAEQEVERLREQAAEQKVVQEEMRSTLLQQRETYNQLRADKDNLRIDLRELEEASTQSRRCEEQAEEARLEEEKRSKASEARAAKLAQDLADVYKQAADGGSSSREHYLRAESRLQGELEAQRQESAELMKRHDQEQRRFAHERDQYAIRVAELSEEVTDRDLRRQAAERSVQAEAAAAHRASAAHNAAQATVEETARRAQQQLNAARAHQQTLQQRLEQAESSAAHAQTRRAELEQNELAYRLRTELQEMKETLAAYQNARNAQFRDDDASISAPAGPPRRSGIDTPELARRMKEIGVPPLPPVNPGYFLDPETGKYLEVTGTFHPEDGQRRPSPGHSRPPPQMRTAGGGGGGEPSRSAQIAAGLRDGFNQQGPRRLVNGVIVGGRAPPPLNFGDGGGDRPYRGHPGNRDDGPLPRTAPKPPKTTQYRRRYPRQPG